MGTEDPSAIVELLHAHAIFEPASFEQLEALSQHAALRCYRPNEPILTAGEPAEHVYALCRGHVRVFHRGPQDQQVVAKLFGAPAIFGEGEAFARISWLVSVEAVDEVMAVEVPTGALLRFFRREPEAAVRMMVDLGVRLAIASDHERSLAFDPATIRLASYLLDYGSWTNPSEAETWRIDLNQTQMAAAVALTRRSVSKDISAWQDEGIIAREAGAYVVRDIEGLRRYADSRRLSLSYSVAQALDALVDTPPSGE